MSESVAVPARGRWRRLKWTAPAPGLVGVRWVRDRGLCEDRLRPSWVGKRGDKKGQLWGGFWFVLLECRRAAGSGCGEPPVTAPAEREGRSGPGSGYLRHCRRSAAGGRRAGSWNRGTRLPPLVLVGEQERHRQPRLRLPEALIASLRRPSHRRRRAVAKQNAWPSLAAPQRSLINFSCQVAAVRGSVLTNVRCRRAHG